MKVRPDNETDAGNFLAGTANSILGADSLFGQCVGAYTIVSLIGRGGMGEVWLAQRSDGRFEGKVAIKFLDASPASTRAHERFEQEGRLLARLAHPHIARLLDAGVTAQDRAYLALEYVEGEPIDRYCDDKSLDVEARLRLFLDVLEAVAHAQSNLVVHRDLKPSNVLVTRDGVVKLLDFGIAKLLDAELAAQTGAPQTRLDERALTPEYAAPEQILGEPVATTTDVYQLGVLLYVLLAGSHPFAQATMSRGELVKAALDTEPPLISDAVTRGRADTGELADALAARRATTSSRLRTVLRGDLDAIVTKALRKEPGERYRTALELAEELRRFLDHQPVAARQGAMAYRTRKFLRRHRGAVLSGSAAALGLIVVTVFALIQTHEARLQRDEARYQAKRAEAVGRFMTLMMGQAGSDGRPVTAEQILDNGLELLEKQYGEDPEFMVDMLVRMSGRYMDMGNTRKEHAALVRAESLARNVGPLSLAKVQCNTVETEIALGDLAAARTRLEDGVAALQRASGDRTDMQITCMNAQAVLASAEGKVDEALQLVERAVALNEREGDVTNNQFITLLSHLEYLYGMLGDAKKALATNQRSQQYLEQTGRSSTQSLLAAKHTEATLLADLGEIRAALALELDVARHGRIRDADVPVHPAVSLTAGELLLRTGEAEQALQWLDEARRNFREQGGAPRAIVADALHASALLALGREAQAQAGFPDLSELAQATDNASRQALARARIIRARFLLSGGATAQAREEIERALTGTRAAKELARHYPAALVAAASIALAEQRNSEAEKLATEALRLREQGARQKNQSADVGESLLLIAKARQAAGNLGGASDAAREALEPLKNGLGDQHALTLQARALLAAGERR